MKKRGVVIILSFIMIFIIPLTIFQGCSLQNFSVTDKIVSPKNKLIPINGVWEIEKYKIINSGSNKYYDEENKPENALGKKAAFNRRYAVFNEEVCQNPQYKIREVDAKYYFFYTYKVNLKELDIDTEKLEVVSITSEGKLFYDFIKLNEEELLVYSDKVFYYLKKVSDKTEDVLNKKNINKLEETKKMNLSKHDTTLRSGVLIGLRSVAPLNYKNSLGEIYENRTIFYRTLWIASKNRELHPVLETPDLFVPRMSGFWWLGIDRQNDNSKYAIDNIFAFPIGNEKIDIRMYTNDKVSRRILFVGNDYVATEYKISSNFSDNEGKSFLQVLPMDNVVEGKGIKISDVAGENGKNALKNSAYAFLSSQNKDLVKRLEKEPKEESFTLVRKNGHWIMKGRLNSNSNEDLAYGDFNINIVPPSKILNYDSFSLSWNDVKGRVPDAKDAYTSPNKDIAIIISANFIYVYEIRNGQLGSKQIKKIPLHEGESVVMSEWATGDYVERWEKTLKSNKVLIVDK